MKRHRITVIFVSVMILGTLSFSAINAQGQYSIPSWVKGVAGFWAEDKITDSDFGEGLSFLISEEIIKVPEMKSLKQEVAQLKTENKNLRGDLEFLEKENRELRSKQGTVISTPTPAPTPSDPLDVYAKNYPVIASAMNGEIRFFIKDIPSNLPWYAKLTIEKSIDEVTDLLQKYSSSKVKLTRVNDQSRADVTIAWIKDFGGHRLGESIFSQYLNIGVGQTDCLSDWKPFDQKTITNILWHEIGHSVGFGHSNDQNNVMYSTTEPRIDIFSYVWGVEGGSRHFIDGWYDNRLSPYDVASLCAGEYSIIVKSEKPVDVQVQDYQSIPIYNESGEIISIESVMICEQKQTTYFNQVCKVPKLADMRVWYDGEGEAYADITIEVIDNRPQKSMKWDKDAYNFPAIYSELF